MNDYRLPIVKGRFVQNGDAWTFHAADNDAACAATLCGYAYCIKANGFYTVRQVLDIDEPNVLTVGGKVYGLATLDGFEPADDIDGVEYVNTSTLGKASKPAVKPAVKPATSKRGKASKATSKASKPATAEPAADALTAMMARMMNTLDILSTRIAAVESATHKPAAPITSKPAVKPAADVKPAEPAEPATSKPAEPAADAAAEDSVNAARIAAFRGKARKPATVK